MSVKRYSLVRTRAFETENGQWVKWTDYEKLRKSKYSERDVRAFIRHACTTLAPHSSAQAGYKCADCQIDGVACSTCLRAWLDKLT